MQRSHRKQGKKWKYIILEKEINVDLIIWAVCFYSSQAILIPKDTVSFLCSTGILGLSLASSLLLHVTVSIYFSVP